MQVIEKSTLAAAAPIPFFVLHMFCYQVENEFSKHSTHFQFHLFLVWFFFFSLSFIKCTGKKVNESSNEKIPNRQEKCFKYFNETENKYRLMG